MLFNIFYKDMIDELSCMNGGISICSEKFNVFCYADDILLASTTVTGLQHLISHANNYITKYGLIDLIQLKQNVLYPVKT